MIVYSRLLTQFQQSNFYIGTVVGKAQHSCFCIFMENSYKIIPVAFGMTSSYMILHMFLTYVSMKCFISMFIKLLVWKDFMNKVLKANIWYFLKLLPPLLLSYSLSS